MTEKFHDFFIEAQSHGDQRRLISGKLYFKSDKYAEKTKIYIPFQS